MSERQTYPGHVATIEQILALAREYHEAARDLLVRGRPGQACSWAPARLLAIQSIELQLNAYLLHTGLSPPQIRCMEHDLARRGNAAVSAGLHLRQKTLLHLHELSIRREYLITRYGPELLGAWTQINRLTATLDEVSVKVRAAVDSKRHPVAPKVKPAAKVLV
jgi:hypothetical protein